MFFRRSVVAAAAVLIAAVVAAVAISAALGAVTNKPLKPGDRAGRVYGKPSERLEELLKIMEEENLHELEIVDGPFEVKLVRQGRVAAAPHAAPRHASAVSRAAASSKGKGGEEDFGKLVPVKSPLAGVFYRSPSPQAAPFIKEGDTVTSERTMCIIEAMKVLNEINAGVSGTVVRILVENGKPVQSGQNLFLVEPAG